MTFWPLWPQMTPDEFLDHNFCRGYLADQCAWVTWPYYLICRRRSILKISRKWRILTFDPLRWGHMTRSPLTFVKLYYCLQDDTIRFWIGAVFIFSQWLTFLTPVTPNDPGWIFRPISFVAIYPYNVLTKFGKIPIKHVEEEADCEKERRTGAVVPLKRHKSCRNIL